MCAVLLFILITVCILSRGTRCQNPEVCGIRSSSDEDIFEGVATMQDYPWMGTLFYDMTTDFLTAAVVLVTKQLVIVSAYELDKIPRADIRLRTRVVLGGSCTGPFIRIREYTFQPQYRRTTLHALGVVQLETDHLQQELVPICPPPNFLHNPTYYAITPAKDCQKGRLQVRKMVYLDIGKCRKFYRKTGLDNGMSWPVDATCAHALRGGNCVWRSGTALALRQQGRWHLLGFGMHGPGCQAPARFTDVGAAAPWLRRTAARAGQGLPAVTRLASNHIVLRRQLSNVQRYGLCDPEEEAYQLYQDTMQMSPTSISARAMYNLTLIQGVEYSCTVMHAMPAESISESVDLDAPVIHLRHWCSGPPRPCYGAQFMEVHLYADITFSFDIIFEVKVYGKVTKVVDPFKGMVYSNQIQKKPATTLKRKLANTRWFTKADVSKINLDYELDSDYVDYKKGQLKEHYGPLIKP